MTDENVPAAVPTNEQRPVLYYFDGKIELVQAKFIVVQNALYREREMTYYNMVPFKKLIFLQGKKVLVPEEWQKLNNALQGIQVRWIIFF